MAKKKASLGHSMMERRKMIDKSHNTISVKRQCELLSIHRSGFYYTGNGESEFNLDLMKVIDAHFLKYPFKGSRRMTAWLKDQRYPVNRKRIQRLYQIMGLSTIYPKPNLSKSDPAAYKYPYLLKDLEIERNNQVWAIDITYVPMKKGFMYLAAIIDLNSRFVINWTLSNTMEAEWICQTIKEAISVHGKPEILNSDQGSQFTSNAYIKLLLDQSIQISMDGKGRATDNIFIERLWRSLKYEYVYLNPPKDGLDLYQGVKEWFRFYNQERHHQSLDNKKPAEIYFKAA